MVKEVASKTSDVAGDGTTTATVLAQSIFHQGLRNVTAGANPMDLKRGIDKAVAASVNLVHDMSKPVAGRSDIAQVATTSANNDKAIGDLIADAMEKVGKDGVITVEEARSIETTLDVVEGMQFDRGYVSPYFVTDADNMEAILEEAYILIHDKKNLGDARPASRTGKNRADGQALDDHCRRYRRRSPRHTGREQSAWDIESRRSKSPGLWRPPARQCWKTSPS